jgi:hypothetical protein
MTVVAGCVDDEDSKASRPSGLVSSTTSSTPSAPSRSAKPSPAHTTLPHTIPITFPDTDPPPEGCLGVPAAVVSAGGEALAMDLVYYAESSPTCGYDADGVYMFDDALRPSRFVLAAEGVVRVLIERSGTMRVTTTPLTPDLRLATADGGGDGQEAEGATAVELAIPDEGCIVVTLHWQSKPTTETEGSSAQMVALAATTPDTC